MNAVLNLLSKAKESGILIELLNEDLELSIIREDFDDSIIPSIKENKADIIQYLKKYTRKTVVKIPKAPESSYYLLSFSQKRLWVLSQFTGGNKAYNITGVYRLEGDLNIDALKKSVTSIIQRHEILRTYFAEDSMNEIQQYVLPFEAVSEDEVFEYIDLRAEETPDNKANEFIQQEFDATFNLGKAPLLRTKLYHIGDRRFCFLFTMHHIISDGWSMGVFFNELLLFYKMNLAELPNTLTPLEIHYKDYAVWQNNYLNSSAVDKDKKYWLKQFADEVPVLNLPIDRPYPALQSYNGSYITKSFSKESTLLLKQHSKDQNGTLYMSVLSLIYILLNKYTSQNDIVLGSPIAGRDVSELENQIGFYVNTLALRIRAGQNETYNSIYSKVREVILGAYSHQNYPFNKLIEILHLERDLSRNPLFEVMVAFHNIDNFKDELVGKIGDLSIQQYNDIENITSKFSLFFNFDEYNDQLNLRLEYNTDLFNQETITRIVDHLEYVLESITHKPDGEVGQIGFINETEKRKLLFDFNNTATGIAIDKTIIQLFEDQVNNNPDKTALTAGNVTLSYAELNMRANQLAHCMIENHSIQPDQFIGILLERDEYLIIGILAILKTGAAYVPIDPSYPKERMKYIINDTQLSLILTTSKFIDVCDDLQWDTDIFTTYICLDESNETSYEEYENDMMDLWNYTAKKSTDIISASGWISSDTSETFSEVEMDEFAENVFNKLKPYLNPSISVLEIGSGTGLIMFKIAPLVKSYKGVDISFEALELCKEELVKRNITNVSLQVLKASEIKSLTESFDIVIINSVVQYFPSLNFVRNFIKDSVSLFSDKGVLFIGDIRDKQLQYSYYTSLNNIISEYELFDKEMNETELFLHRGFIEDCFATYQFKTDISFSLKTGAIQNELFKYRFDCLIELVKGETNETQRHPNKKQIIGYKGLGLPENPKHGALVASAVYVIYTSGSSGTPKGVVIENKQLAYFFQNIRSTFNIDENLIIGATTNFTFDISILELLGGLTQGIQTNLLRNPQPDSILEVVKSGKINVLQITPTRLVQLIEFDPVHVLDILNTLNILIIGGEKIDEVVLGFLKKLNSVQVIQVYGPTETTIWSTYAIIDSTTVKPVIGKPLLNEIIHILDEDNKLQPIGVLGEICIGGKGVARGYLNNPELTYEKFIDNPFLAGSKLYKTGDYGCWLPDGNIEFKGRKDDQIKINGHRVELTEIENVLLGFTGVKYCAVIPRLTTHSNHELVAYILSDTELHKSAIMSYLSHKLPKHMVPFHYVRIDSIPMMINGKLDRKSLVRQHGSLIENAEEFIAPRNSIEADLLEMWKNILNASRLSVMDDFFKNGGDSLKATKLRSLIINKYKVSIELDQIFNNSTINDQAIIIEDLLYNSRTTVVRIPKADTSEYYPLSYAQRRLWVLSQFEGGNIAYNITGVFKLKGDLDLNAFMFSVKSVVKRHEIVRTCFAKDNNEEIQQYVINYDDICENQYLNFFDLRNDNNPEKIVKELIQTDFEAEFDLSKAPLVRIKLYQLDDNNFIFLYTMHHIISDGWSMGVFLNELLSFYNASVKNEVVYFQDLPIQYKDYSVWQNNYLNDTSNNLAEKYWINQLNGEIPIINLPVDRPYPVNKTYNGNDVSKTFSKELTGWLKKHSNENKGTLFMSSLSLVYILLAKYSGQNDIIFGTPIAGRDNSELENQIGFYVNTLALRIEASENESYSDIYSKVRKVVLGAYTHQNYPFDKLIEHLDLERDLSRNPLFDVMVAFNNIENFNAENLVNTDDLIIEEYDGIVKKTSKFSLLFYFSEFENELNLRLEYNSDLFNEDTMIRLLNHLEQLLEGIVQQPRLSVHQIDYITETEKQQLLDVFNETQKNDFDQNRSCVDLFEEQVQKAPENVAVVFDNQEITYQQLNEQANQLSHYLIEKYEIQANDLIGLEMKRDENFIVALLGILKSGAGYVPIDPEYPQQRIDFIKGNNAFKLIINEEEFLRISSCLTNYSKQNANVKIEPGSLVYIIYSSGSTGIPKGIMMEHKSMYNLVCFHNKEFEHRNCRKVSQFTSISFDVSFQEIMTTLTTGATLFPVKDEVKKNMQSFLLFLSDKEIDTVFLPTAYFRILTEIDQYYDLHKGGKLKHIIVAGEKLILGKEAVSKLREVGANIHNHYGPAETHVVTTISLSGDNLTENPTIGKPISNNRIYILDEHKQPVAIGITGKVFISGEGVARGYLNLPELTREKFIENPFIAGQKMYDTGDLGYWLSDGSIHFIGRKDFQVKIRGYRVELGEIENTILQFSSGIKQIVVDTKEINKQNILVGYIVADVVLDKTDLRNFLENRLPEYMIPDFYVILDELPLNPNGKIDHKALPEISDKDVIRKEYIAPRNQDELELVLIWQEILGIEKIGITDNFFELGGNSLNAIKIISKINQMYPNQNLMIGHLFLHKSILNLVNEMKSATFYSEFQDNGIVHFNEKITDDLVLILPGVDGVLDAYFDLIQFLNKKYFVVGVDFTQLTDQNPEIDSIQNIAEKIQDQFSNHSFNTIQIIGHSFGGIVAYELSKRMEIDHVLILDMIPDFEKNESEQIAEQDTYSANLAKEKGVDQFLKFKKKSTEFIQNYIQEQVQTNSKLTLFEATDGFFNKSKFEGWKNLTAQFEHIQIQGDHHTIVNNSKKQLLDYLNSVTYEMEL